MSSFDTAANSNSSKKYSNILFLFHCPTKLFIHYFIVNIFFIHPIPSSELCVKPNQITSLQFKNLDFPLTFGGQRKLNEDCFSLFLDWFTSVINSFSLVCFQLLFNKLPVLCAMSGTCCMPSYFFIIALMSYITSSPRS